ncbi:MAG TPA: Ig-like domain-containing protein [Vicinamibacterales bacterium]|nr:Ig-like domain-containing protein [Vicinamibacterales bacterium]
MATTAMVACTTTTPPIAIASLLLQPGLDSIEVGGTYNGWVVTLRDAQGELIAGPRNLQWDSQNPFVATIDASTGVVTAVATGETLITLRAEGKSATAAIRVIHPVLSIVVTPDSFDLPLTTSRTLTVQLVGPNGVALTNRLIQWSSANPSVAVVGTSGQVTAVTMGSTTITVRAGQKSATVKVRVIAEPVQSVRILPQQTVQVIRVGQAKQLSAECLSATQQVLPGRTITWNSGNPIAATVSNGGLVSALSVGQANITATCDGTVNTSILAQVTPVPVSSVTITPGSLSLTGGMQGQLLAVARDSAGNVLSLQGRTVTWLTDNQPVASVTNAGVVQGGQPGDANITAVVDGVASAPVLVSVFTMFSAVTPSVDPRFADRRLQSLVASR